MDVAVAAHALEQRHVAHTACLIVGRHVAECFAVAVEVGIEPHGSFRHGSVIDACEVDVVHYLEVTVVEGKLLNVGQAGQLLHVGHGLDLVGIVACALALKEVGHGAQCYHLVVAAK